METACEQKIEGQMTSSGRIMGEGINHLEEIA
jgi:hypothetical protein